MQPAAVPAQRLANFPIAFFATVMGLAGLTIAWEKAQHVYHVDLHLAVPMVGVTAAVFVAMLGLYGLKFLRHRDAVLAELRHPVKLNFFPTLSISLLLLAIALLTLAPSASRPLWIAGTALHLVFTLYVVNVWMHRAQAEIQHLNPAWFIPAVGNVLVPVAGVPLGFTEISWFFFSVGMLFWVILLTNIFYRVMFHHPIDERLLPTLFILIAPPAVGFISYMRLTGELDPFARVLYYAALFLTLLLLVQAPRFARLRFFLSWWAYSFPLAAISIASMVMYDHTGIAGFRLLGTALLGLLSVLVVLLLARTAVSVSRRAICQPGH